MKAFVIILSTAKYEDAEKFAEDASNKMNMKLDFRGLKPHPVLGLSAFGEENDRWEKIGFNSPLYVPRGIEDDLENFISIESSNNYLDMKPGYYIVMISCGAKDSRIILSGLDIAKKYFKDAYIRYSRMKISG